jgi:uncharacterized repeat protein (TIGR03803 family)
MPENPSRVSGVRQSPRSVRHASATETVLHSFGGYPYDGALPETGLTYFKGTLYGTTLVGGASMCRGGCGTVYSITPSGTETVLHSFTGGKDGAIPLARMIVLNGTLYGTTLLGGGRLIVSSAFSCSKAFSPVTGFGTVFSITPSGKETIVHAFVRSREGWWPEAPLLNVNGTMYGTTCGGGAIHRTKYFGGYGTAFTITPSGYEHAIYSFQFAGGTPPSDGRLLYLNGTLYGTTNEGGKYDEGVVFSLSTSGKEKLLHSFNDNGNKIDGSSPKGGLVAIKHTLYGVTSGGGAYGDGTVFSITPTGTETILHSFDGVDGDAPEATPLNVNGTLYGTTVAGGNLTCQDRYGTGCGTVFAFDIASGRERVIYSFNGGKDGAAPLSGVIDVNGVLYGTTSNGGSNVCFGAGCGTVFSIKL